MITRFARAPFARRFRHSRTRPGVPKVWTAGKGRRVIAGSIEGSPTGMESGECRRRRQRVLCVYAIALARLRPYLRSRSRGMHARLCNARNRRRSEKGTYISRRSIVISRGKPRLPRFSFAESRERLCSCEVSLRCSSPLMGTFSSMTRIPWPDDVPRAFKYFPSQKRKRTFRWISAFFCA